jgi:hypothetical protein
MVLPSRSLSRDRDFAPRKMEAHGSASSQPSSRGKNGAALVYRNDQYQDDGDDVHERR